jgi:hypothetical protein
MAFEIGFAVLSGYDSQDNAERVIEVFLPAGFTYHVTEQRLARRLRMPACFQIEAYDKDGKFAGYCRGWETQQEKRRVPCG